MKKRANLNAEIMNTLQERYGFSLDYIRKSLRGDRKGILPDKLIQEYKALDAAAKKAIEIKAENLN
jgi:hypothetical protein